MCATSLGLLLLLLSTGAAAQGQIALPATGDIDTVAGYGTDGYSGDNGLATAAELKNPYGVAVDATGNIYIADTSNNRIRKVTVATGIISTVAGNGTAGDSGDGGDATSAEMDRPTGIAVDITGNVYIATFFNNRIRAVNQNRTASTITWATPVPITYGTALSASQLNATASVPGTFVYTPAAGTVPSAGTQTLSVTFTPTDPIDYASATSTVTITVNKVTPVITWVIPLNAMSTIAGTFVYSPAIGTVLTSGMHTLTVAFFPADTTNYTTATSTAAVTVIQ